MEPRVEADNLLATMNTTTSSMTSSTADQSGSKQRRRRRKPAPGSAPGPEETKENNVPGRPRHAVPKVAAAAAKAPFGGSGDGGDSRRKTTKRWASEQFEWSRDPSFPNPKWLDPETGKAKFYYPGENEPFYR